MVRSLAEKFTSRKFLACLAGVVIGLCTVFGLEQNTVTTVSGAVVSLASLVTYILAEGKIDAAAVLSAVEILQEELIPQETETPVNPDESANRETPVDPDRPGETEDPPTETQFAGGSEPASAAPAESILEA